MIVNDDPDIAELFAAGLEHGGFKTIICNDALSAVEKMRISPDQFSLVLVDRTSQQDTDFPKQVKKISKKMKVVLTSAFYLVTLKYQTLDMTRFYNYQLQYLN